MADESKIPKVRRTKRDQLHCYPSSWGNSDIQSVFGYASLVPNDDLFVWVPTNAAFFFWWLLVKKHLRCFFWGETILCASGLYLKMLRSCLDSLHSFQPTKLKFDFATSFRHRGHCLRSKSTCCWWTGGFGTWGHGDGGGLVGDPRFWKKGSWYRDWTIKYHEKMTHKSWQMLFGLGQSNIVTDTFQQMQRQ